MTTLFAKSAVSASSEPHHHVPQWLPNAITLLRIALLIPFVGALGLEQASQVPPTGARGAIALGALLAIGASDVIDGYLARRFDLASRLGVILDALADKIAQLGITSYFVFLTTLLPLWFLVLLVVRDLLIGVGTWIVSRAAPGMPLRHRAHGKAASALMFALFVWTLVGRLEAGRRSLLYGVSALVILSTVAYTVEGVAQWRDRRGWDQRLRRSS